MIITLRLEILVRHVAMVVMHFLTGLWRFVAVLKVETGSNETSPNQSQSQ